MQEAAVVFFVEQFQIGDEATARGLCSLAGLRVVAALRDVAPVKADAAFLPGGQVVVVDAARVQQVVFFCEFEPAELSRLSLAPYIPPNPSRTRLASEY